MRSSVILPRSSIRFFSLALSLASGVIIPASARFSLRLLCVISLVRHESDRQHRSGDRNSQSNLADPIENPSDCARQFVPAYPSWRERGGMRQEGEGEGGEEEPPPIQSNPMPLAAAIDRKSRARQRREGERRKERRFGGGRPPSTQSIYSTRLKGRD